MQSKGWLIYLSLFIGPCVSYLHRQWSPRLCYDTRLSAERAPVPKWPGNRPPVTNPARMELSMDATWGRGKYRTEVWEDDVNPVDFWWEAYEPSVEEAQAAAAGYDFGDPKGWLEARGIDYKKALEELEIATQEQYKEFCRRREQAEQRYNEEDLYEQLKIFARRKFRERDNEKQAAKGQPSLDDEDTGAQWRNDNSAKSATV